MTCARVPIAFALVASVAALEACGPSAASSGPVVHTGVGSSSSSEAAPSWVGWKVLTTAAVHREGDCIGRGARWRLAHDGSGRVMPMRAGGKALPALPRVLERQPALRKELSNAGRYSFAETEQGLLVAVDHGELGSNLYFIESGSGAASEPLQVRPEGAEPVRWVARMRFGIIGVAGLCHGDVCAARSKVYHLEPAAGRWTATMLAEWKGCPATPAVDAGGNGVLIATCGSLERVTMRGREILGRWPKGWNLPAHENSIAQDEDGSYLVSSEAEWPGFGPAGRRRGWPRPTALFWAPRPMVHAIASSADELPLERPT